MRYCSTVLGITKPLNENIATSVSDNRQKSYGFRVAHPVEYVRKLGIFRGAVGVHNVPKSLSFGRRLFGVEGRDIKLSEISSDVTVAAIVIPAPQSVPIAFSEIARRGMGPCYV